MAILGCMLYFTNFFLTLLENQLYVPLLKQSSKYGDADIARLVSSFNCSTGLKHLFWLHLEKWRSSFATQPSINMTIAQSMPSITDVRSLAGFESNSMIHDAWNASDSNPNHPSLAAVLTGTPQGKSIVAHYNHFKSLNTGVRDLLVEAIGNYYGSSGLKSLSTNGCWSIAKQIQETFVGEKLVCKF